MKRLLVAALLLLVLVTTAGLGYEYSGDPWVELHERLKKSTARLSSVAQHDTEVGSCSTFSINESRRYWMTAFHCLGAEMLVDGQIAWIIYKNETHDLAILEAPGRSGPSLKLASTPPAIGDQMASLGYGYGYAIPQFRRGTVAALDLPGENVDILNPKTTVTVFDVGWMGGMSGSAVVNVDGEVISIVQVEEGGRSGLGRPLATIREHTQQFFD